MTFYPQKDWQTISAMPGCERGHERPADPATGEPVLRWAVTCPAHEAYYKGDGKPKILRFVTDKNTGKVIRQDRVPDVHPGVGFTPDTVPLTFDEGETRTLQMEKGENQLRALESIANLKAAGIDIRNRPDVLLYLRENQLPDDILRGSLVCVNGHDVVPGNAFCGQCGASMSARASLEQAPAAPAAPRLDLAALHVQSLRKMAREKGLPDKGSKGDLIKRLAA